ncbi:MAG: 2-oxo acid dehydrogenase subunit E2 [Bacteroidales bacterium]|nr:2-oxo acid dehydrogenase subunit E2 [Bacteroidales bacterium]MBN2761673.1 2-oxo acid dehydrogenase subunit E2 [Bacteroidales bacterium]
MPIYKTQLFPKTRIATIDVCEIGMQKHHIPAFIEIDITESRKKIKKYKSKVGRISFTAWLIKVISLTVKDHPQVAAFHKEKRKVVIFNDINVSMAVEKTVDGRKVPIPLVIEKAHERSIESITKQINEAIEKTMTDKDIVLHARAKRLELLYYHLPGFLRRSFWRYLLKHPRLAYKKMGNVAVTAVGMMGNINGWFIPVSVHPVCFGIGRITKKPVVVDDKTEIREMLNMTILLDHDVIDGAPMVRFVSDLSANIEKGLGLVV